VITKNELPDAVFASIYHNLQ